MSATLKTISAALLVGLGLGACGNPAPQAVSAAVDGQVYRFGPASRDGIGKFYEGREISHVMGHLGAGWLERGSREREERTDLLLEFLVSLGARYGGGYRRRHGLFLPAPGGASTRWPGVGGGHPAPDAADSAAACRGAGAG